MVAKMPTHAVIRDTWARMDALRVAETYGERVVGNIDSCLEGEFCCWCCGRPVIKLKSLERAHINPKMLGGSFEPSNIFLMCPPCHRESPDLPDPKFFARFVKDKEDWWFSTLKKISKIASEFDIEEGCAEKCITIFKESALGQHGGRIMESTLLGAVEMAMDQVYKRKGTSSRCVDK